MTLCQIIRAAEFLEEIFYYLLYMQDTWEKRLAYIQIVVELIAVSSENKATHNTSYAQPISHLFETALDIAVHGKFLKVHCVLQSLLWL